MNNNELLLYRFEVAAVLVNLIPKNQAVTADELRRVVKDIPTMIQDVYEMIIKRIWAQEPHLARLGMDALSWVYFCKRRLTVTELQHALSFQHLKGIPGAILIEEDQILAACCELIAFVELGDKEGTVECQFFGEYDHCCEIIEII